MGQEARLTKRALGWSLAWLCTAAALPAAVQANDRPYLLTSNAAAEEDDDNVWSVETAWQRIGDQHLLSIAPEYAFNPTTSIQFEFSRSSGENANGLEVELKHLFNHIAREGWGWGVHLSLGMASVGGTAWRSDSIALKLPYTLQLRDGDAFLHLNAGVLKQREERREWVGSVAFEHKLPWRSTAFVEVGREDRQTLWHAGVRHWIRREKLAVDFSVQQLRGGGEKASGVVIGVAWYDL
jgi:hypothetical protein